MSFRLAAEMLVLGGAAADLRAAEARVAAAVAGGDAMRTFRAWVAANGGNPEALDDFSLLPGSRRTVAVLAPQDGYVQGIRGRDLGVLAMELGAGRRSQDDVLDPGVGIRVEVRVGQKVEAGQKLLTLYCNDREPGPLPAGWITLGPEPRECPPWLLESLD
jgi:pyrimidine-nucleoside phosphorylase